MVSNHHIIKVKQIVSILRTIVALYVIFLLLCPCLHLMGLAWLHDWLLLAPAKAWYGGNHISYQWFYRYNVTTKEAIKMKIILTYWCFMVFSWCQMASGNMVLIGLVNVLCKLSTNTLPRSILIFFNLILKNEHLEIMAVKFWNILFRLWYVNYLCRDHFGL